MIFDEIGAFGQQLTDESPLMALDVGTARIGIALSDTQRCLASPFDRYERRTMRQDIGFLTRIARDNNIGGWVIGLPLELDGSEGENCAAMRLLAAKIVSKTQRPVLLYDERLTTAAVTRSMKGAGVKRKDRHAKDDELAACYLLQMVLDGLAS